jgi:hypothetical protein
MVDKPRMTSAGLLAVIAGEERKREARRAHGMPYAIRTREGSIMSYWPDLQTARHKARMLRRKMHGSFYVIATASGAVVPQRTRT